MIRILTVVRHPVGGIRTYLKYTYAALPAGKYRFTVIAVRSLESAQLARDLQPQGIRVIEVPDARPAVALMRAAAGVIRRREADLIHSQGFTSGVLSAIASLPHGLPHVITSHDVFRADQFTGFRGRVKARALRSLLGRADFIQSVSADAQENLAAFLRGLDERSLTVISNGIDLARFEPAAGAARRTWTALSDDRFVFGFFGRLMPQKGFEDLIEATALLANSPRLRQRFRVRVVSDGGYIREHRAAIATRGLSSWFEFAGFVSEIASAIGLVDAVVMPSLWEACPLVPMETLVAGCPLLASRCIGLREVVAGTPALTFDPQSPRALAAAMRDALERHATLRRATLDYVPEARRRFDVHRTARALDELLERARARRVAAPRPTAALARP